MKLLVIYIGIGALCIAAVEGLQCYVCEDCNEYQDFKEIHICGEISSIVVTQKPSTLPEILATNSTSTTLKPPPSGDTEEYMYDYSMESNDANGSTSDRGSNTTAVTIAPSPTNPTTTNATIQGLEGNTTLAPTAGAGNITEVNSTSLKPVSLPEDYDYMEYEDPKAFKINGQPKVSGGSVLRIDEPVCYMYRYYENNTVFTNRGCTILLNSNKFLTCQALSNGTPMVGCRVCTTDGCNKFDLDESGEDHLLNTGVHKKCSALAVAILGFMISIIV